MEAEASKSEEEIENRKTEPIPSISVENEKDEGRQHRLTPAQREVNETKKKTNDLRLIKKNRREGNRPACLCISSLLLPKKQKPKRNNTRNQERNV